MVKLMNVVAFAATAQVMLAMPIDAQGGWNANIGGNVTYVTSMPSGIVTFKLSNQPTTGCVGNEYFSFSPASIPDIESRNHFLALLLMARTSGSQVTIGYDTSASCDSSGYPMPFAITLNP